MVLVAAAAMLGASVYATTLNDIFQVAERMNVNPKKSHAKIDALNEDTRRLLSDYKIVLKEIEGLRVYNRQLEKQISNQFLNYRLKTISNAGHWLHAENPEAFFTTVFEFLS